MKTRRTKLAGLLGAVVALAAAIAAALAVSGAAATAETEIKACQHPNGGWLRIAGAAGCRTREQAVAWNVAGPAGPKGDPGPAGPKGDPGAGLGKLEDLNGLACTAEGGAAGKVSLDSAGDDTVLIRCVAGGSPPPPPPPAAKLVINEVDYDQVGADTDGFVEIKNTGTTAVTLTGFALVLVDGGDSEEYRRHALTGSIEPGAYLVVATDAQNGAPDGIAIVDTASGALVDALSYEGAISAAKIGTQTHNLVEGTLLPITVADSNTVAGSLVRNPDGKDTNDAAADWAFTKTLTRGATNVLTP
jgi:hypothetical protein